MATPHRTKNDWIALLESANAGPVGDEIPKGYKDLSKILEEFDISETTWRRRIPILEETGVMVRGYFNVVNNGRAFKKPFWKRAK